MQVILRKLCKALRSGRYTKTKGALKKLFIDNNGNKVWGHCCLGVGCDLYNPNKWCESDAPLIPKVVMSYLGVTGELPYQVDEFYGIGSTGDFYIPIIHDYDDGTKSKVYVSLAEVNDCNRHLSDFPEIADIIEWIWLDGKTPKGWRYEVKQFS